MEVRIVVAKETYELGLGLAGFVKAVKRSVADGWQPFTDIPVAVSAAVSHLAPALQGADKIVSEAKNDPGAFAHALVLSGVALYQAVMK